MSKERLNIELFKKVRRKIKTVPASYRQSTDAETDQRSPCGTAACIGGWADILSAPNKAERDKRMGGEVDLNRAARELGLKGRDFYGELRTERAVLFDGRPEKRWPKPFSDQWRRARTKAGRAAVAVAYLDHIIETGKILE
jgi:hypothetical protein